MSNKETGKSHELNKPEVVGIGLIGLSFLISVPSFVPIAGLGFIVAGHLSH